MGEALIIRKGGSGGGAKVEYKLTTDILTANAAYRVPSYDTNKGMSIRIFGGGAGEYGSGCGGGGGWMNNGIFTNIPIGSSVSVVIGSGGTNGSAGGTSSFGSYLSAPGGSGSDGGTGGGGVGQKYGSDDGGDATYGGGGGGGGTCGYGSPGAGGNGGKWGGGGGAGCAWSEDKRRSGGTGGTYGGAGGRGSVRAIGGTIYAENGSRGTTISATTIEDGTVLVTSGAGGARSVNLRNSWDREDGWYNMVWGAGGGGGGYGGCGGAAGNGQWTGPGGGGGGGYGANGGNGIDSSKYGSSGGGGGGYGGKGADGVSGSGGGGGGYGRSNYGAGGGGTAINGSNGKQGVCIIQYYKRVITINGEVIG